MVSIVIKTKEFMLNFYSNRFLKQKMMFRLYINVYTKMGFELWHKETFSVL